MSSSNIYSFGFRAANNRSYNLLFSYNNKLLKINKKINEKSKDLYKMNISLLFYKFIKKN